MVDKSTREGLIKGLGQACNATVNGVHGDCCSIKKRLKQHKQDAKKHDAAPNGVDHQAIKASCRPAVVHGVVVVDLAQPLVYPAVALNGLVGACPLGAPAGFPNAVGKIWVAEAVKPCSVGEPCANAILLFLQPGQMRAGRLKEGRFFAGLCRANCRLKPVKALTGSAVDRNHRNPQCLLKGWNVQFCASALHLIDHGDRQDSRKAHVQYLGKDKEASF